MINLIEIIKENSLTQEEDIFYKKAIKDNIYKECLYNDELNKKLLALLPYNNLTDYYFSFDTCATNIIKSLFDKYTDEETLILSTYSEHPNVNNILDSEKNVNKIIKPLNFKNYYEGMFTLSQADLTNLIKRYKKVFVYCIGTSCGLGVVNNNYLFKKIKSICKSLNKECILVLDAVQELFLLFRDYSLFDYVIGTAHALIPDYNIGVCLSKTKNEFKFFSNIEDFYKLLSCLLKRKTYLTNFTTLLQDYYDYLYSSDIDIHANVNHLFALGNSEGTLIPLISKSSIDKMYGYFLIEFRACHSIFKSLDTIKKIKEADAFFKNLGF